MLEPVHASPLASAHAGLRRAQDALGPLSLQVREQRLRALRRALKQRAHAFTQAVSADFGGRSAHETLLADVAVVLAAIDYALSHMQRWARPETVSVGWRFWPARARIIKVPRGIAGIIGTWNYPVQMSLLPLVAAISAGCRVMLKPSELAPASAALTAGMLGEVFTAEEVVTVLGGPEVAAALTHLPLDVLLFTGSNRVGQLVAQAAAEHLTPLTLELGGKSPVLLDPSAPLEEAAHAIVAGKLFNAGQTCVAPDYVLVPQPMRDRFVDAARTAARALYPHPEQDAYSAIRGDAARERLLALLEGSVRVPLFDVTLPPPKLTAALVIQPALDSRIMREEIFGPLLPVLGYEDLEQALAIMATRPCPLALYWFGRDRDRLARVLERTRSGTVSVNDTVVHAAIQSLPFGGLGASGIGAYHGQAGFDTFTHRRAVFMQSPRGTTRLMRPPYGARAARVLRFLLR